MFLGHTNSRMILFFSFCVFSIQIIQLEKETKQTPEKSSYLWPISSKWQPTEGRTNPLRASDASCAWCSGNTDWCLWWRADPVTAAVPAQEGARSQQLSRHLSFHLFFFFSSFSLTHFQLVALVQSVFFFYLLPFLRDSVWKLNSWTKNTSFKTANNINK